MAVNPCIGDIVVTNDNTQDDIAIPNAMAGSKIGRSKILFPNLTKFSPPIAFIIFVRPNDITVNIPAINIPVNNFIGSIGLINDNTQDDIVKAAAIITKTNPVSTNLSFGKSSCAIFSKAVAITNIANDNPITDKKSTSPTILKAKPIANTATAINSIVPIPSFSLLVLFLSPDSSITLVGSLFFLDISKIVSWFFRIASVSLLIDFTAILISFICVEKSPL